MKCPSCLTDNTKGFNFCNNCGSKLLVETVPDYENSVKKTKVFFFVLLGYIASLHYIQPEGGYLVSLLTDFIFAAIVSFFFFRNIATISPLLRKPADVKLLSFISLCMIILAFSVSHFAHLLNSQLFETESGKYYEAYLDSPAPLLFAIISVGVFPAIFEELAFRGILFNELQNLMPVKATIIISAMLFTILHFSMISFIWIFPIGLLFGHLRAKHNTLLYGMIGHFVYNTSIVLIEYFGL